MNSEMDFLSESEVCIAEGVCCNTHLHNRIDQLTMRTLGLSFVVTIVTANEITIQNDG